MARIGDAWMSSVGQTLAGRLLLNMLDSTAQFETEIRAEQERESRLTL